MAGSILRLKCFKEMAYCRSYDSTHCSLRDPEFVEDKQTCGFCWKGDEHSVAIYPEGGTLKVGDPDRIRGSCNGLTSLSKNMDGMGEKWWSYIPAEYQERFDKNLAAAIKRGSNIWRTVGDYWKTPDSVLKETITGPIDEKDLLRYLNPGEQP